MDTTRTGAGGRFTFRFRPPCAGQLAAVFEGGTDTFFSVSCLIKLTAG